MSCRQNWKVATFGWSTIILSSTIGLSAAAYANVCTMKRVSVPQVCGRVLDVTGKSIENIEIALERNKQAVASTRTDSLGNFKLEDVEKGDYELVVRSAIWNNLR